MNKKIIIVVLFLSSLLIISNFTGLKTITAYPEPNYKLKVLVIPLDSRPACTTFVVELAKIANINIILPPNEILDNYQQPANKDALINWLKQTAPKVDYAIISTDMLIHGGLLNSRLATGTLADEEKALTTLQEVHNNNPHLKLSIFNIIPRIWLPDNASKYQQQILEYSKLKDKASQTNAESDFASLKILEQTIPTDIIENYNALFERNYNLNVRLLNLVQDNVISNLVIGQDDGQQYGISNIVKNRLYKDIEKLNNKENINITRGTDEVALTLLGQIIGEKSSLKVKVIYNNSNSPSIIMPYMPHSVDKTIQEKLKIINLTRVDNEAEADFILFVNIGIDNNKTEQEQSAAIIKELLKENKNVAIVDLSKNFSGEETLLPTLLAQNIPINQLIAYAGWNTTSNSVGTALTQSLAFLSEKSQITSTENLKLLYKNNLTFLVNRFSEDYYFLKEIQPKLAKYLSEQKIDTTHLNNNYDLANEYIIKEITKSNSTMISSKAFKQPINVYFNNQHYQFKIINSTVQAKLPWERIFEISLQTNLTLASDIKN